MERLYFSTAQVRRMYGKDNPGFPSEFLKAIGKEKLNETGFNIRSTVNRNISEIKKPTPLVERKNISTAAGFRVGDKIQHKIFGKGVIVESYISPKVVRTISLSDLLENYDFESATQYARMGRGCWFSIDEFIENQKVHWG
jgi:hypothetical protein